MCMAKLSHSSVEYLRLNDLIRADLGLRTDPGIIFQVQQSVLTTVHFANEGSYRLSSW